MSDQSNLDPRRFTSAAGALGSDEIADVRSMATRPPEPSAAMDESISEPLISAAVPLPSEGRLPPLDGAIAWLNSQPLTADDLHGRVVLVDFWTYTCINWLRTLPYVRAWANKYKDPGVMVIGVHTPEFPFEHEVENVRRAAKDMGVEYPIAIDSDYAIWRAFSNHYWPALYIADATGHIRHHHFGEGGYEQSELIIQQVLAESGIYGIGHDLVSVDAHGIEAAADWDDLESPETYLGSERAENFESPGGADVGAHAYALPARLSFNHWALAGEWTVERGFAALHTAGGRIAYRFHARDLHLILRPATRGSPVRFRVRIDGRSPGAAHGADVDDHGNGTVTEPRTYQLIRQPRPIKDRQFEIEFLDAGVEAYAFTFG